MSPSNNVGMELPPPVNEQVPPVNLPEQAEPNQEQQTTSPYETGAGANANQPLPTSSPAIPDFVNATPPPVSKVAASDDNQTDDLSADDGDLIEKEWVDKAKAIVQRTKEDPYKQNEELTVLKADYLQKRYNKTLKQSN